MPGEVWAMMARRGKWFLCRDRKEGRPFFFEKKKSFLPDRE
jgi:hypothetical protein